MSVWQCACFVLSDFQSLTFCVARIARLTSPKTRIGKLRLAIVNRHITLHMCIPTGNVVPIPYDNRFFASTRCGALTA